ncbi:MAG: alpha/beta fold hydrolase [Haloglomus sp.]
MTINEERVEADGVGIHYLRVDPGGSDDGPPVVLLHGGIVDSARLSWGGVLEPLAAALGRPVVAPDLAGYGESDRPVAAYSMTYHVGVVRAFCDALGLERADLCGLSLGGGVALGLALGDDRIERVVAIDSFGLGTDLSSGLLTWAVAQVPSLNRLSLALLARSRRLTRASLGNIVADPDAVPDAVVDELFDLLQGEDPGYAFRRWRAAEVTREGYATTYVPLLSDLQQPVCFLHGAEDEVFPLAWSERAADLAPEGECVVLEDCAHWPPREQPEAVVEHVSRFLGEA